MDTLPSSIQIREKKLEKRNLFFEMREKEELFFRMRELEEPMSTPR
jgi:hypothetical protein